MDKGKRMDKGKGVDTDEGMDDAYYIINVQTGDYASLPGDSDRLDIINTSDSYDPGCEWLITHVKRDEYRIQNATFKSFAAYDNRPEVGARVLGKWDRPGSKPSAWRMRSVPGPNFAYTISPLENPDIFWMSMSNVEGTPLELGQPWTAENCQWVFRAVGSNAKPSPIVPWEGANDHVLMAQIEEGLRESFVKRLKPSKIADHQYELEGQERKLLRRTACTPGTRLRILDAIATWARDTSPSSPVVYWLFGLAGSGKSTIAYTLARSFSSGTSVITLGANFFCSRQFEETKESKRIIPTIAYHLALACRPFADALRRSAGLESVERNVKAQIQGLLVGPWQASQADRTADALSPKHYLIIIDALDEIDGGAGSNILRDLFEAFNEGQLQGLKVFATSRPDPDLVTVVNSFHQRRLYRLQDVELEEVSSDIRLYLAEELPDFANREEMGKLVILSDGLFIYAATIARYLAGYKATEREELLKQLLSGSDSSIPKRSDEDSPALDKLYLEILNHAFDGLDDAIRVRRLQILHTFMCTVERTSGTVVAHLLCNSSRVQPYIDGTVAILEKLNAVLYTENDRVLSYHKSFSDLLFSRSRSQGFFCDQAMQHQLLNDSCFRMMTAGLRFNIANIPSSYILDRDDSSLLERVNRNIPDVLGYSCRNWSHHLCFTAITTTSDSKYRLLSEFIQLPALFWIESMNLLGSQDQCDSILRSAANWVRKTDSALAGQLTEAANFALYFSLSPAASSTPHLYISALVTWPGISEPCLGWRARFPRVPAFINPIRGGSGVLMRIKLEPEAGVFSVAVSPDGNQIVSGCTDKSVRVWDASTGKLLKLLSTSGHTDSVSSVAFSSDCSRIVSGSYFDDSVRVWDPLTGKSLKVLSGHAKAVCSVALSSDGSLVAVGSYDNLVHVWDALTGKSLNVLSGHTNAVCSVAFSSDGSRIVSGSYDNSVRVWDALTGKSLKLLSGHTGWVSSVASSSGGGRIVSGASDRSVRVWDTLMGKLLKLFSGHTDLVSSVAFSSDDSLIVSGSHDNSVRVWDALTGKSLKVLSGHTGYVNSVTFSSDGSRIISGSDDRSVRVWDASTVDLPKVSHHHKNTALSALFARLGGRPWTASSSSDKSTDIWHASTDKPLKALNGHTGWVRSVIFSSDGNRIVSGSDDKSVRIWDALTGKSLKVLSGHTDLVRSVALSSDGSRIASGSYDNSVRIWDASTGKLLRVLRGHTDWVSSVAFTSDGSRIVSGSGDGSVQVWDASTGKSLKILCNHTRAVSSVTFSSDGSRIVYGCHDNSVRVRDALTGKLLKVLRGHTDQVNAVAISSDGSLIISGSYDNFVRVWDALTGESIKVLSGHSHSVCSVAFSSDASQIVSGSADYSVRVWDTSTGESLEVLMRHTDTICSVAFSSDGNRVVSGSHDNSVRVWDTSPSYLMEYYVGPYRNWMYTGWLLTSSAKNRLMFVPPEVKLPIPPNILIISSSPPMAGIDFSHAAVGIEWHNCYRP